MVQPQSDFHFGASSHFPLVVRSKTLHEVRRDIVMAILASPPSLAESVQATVDTLRNGTDGDSWLCPSRESLRRWLNTRSSRSDRRAKCGGQGRNRTADTAIFSRMLYQLSYLAARRDFRVYRADQSACNGLCKNRLAAEKIDRRDLHL